MRLEPWLADSRASAVADGAKVLVIYDSISRRGISQLHFFFIPFNE